MKTIVLGVLAMSLTLMFSLVPIAQPSPGNLLVNGDFETGTFDGWNVGGTCIVTNAIAHNGSYSAYISDAGYDNWIWQYPRVSADYDWRFEGWIYPLRVGSLGPAQYPYSDVTFLFYNSSSMVLAFEVSYCWCWNTAWANSSSLLKFWLPFNQSEWNFLSGDLAADVRSYFASVNLSELMLYSITAEYHRSNGNPGAFYVDALQLYKTPLISDVSGMPDVPNYDRNVDVTAVTQAADQAVLSYTTDGTNWYNASMSKSGDVFNATIPAQSWHTTVQYMIYANNTDGNWAESDTYSYVVGDFVAPEILSVDWRPACPIPYVPSNVTRMNEPTQITANVSEPVNASGVASVLISYRVDNDEWCNMSMKFNATTGLWATKIPGQSNDSRTVEFFIAAYDVAENLNTSPTYSYSIKPLLASDINGDGKVDVKDVAYVCKDYGMKGP